MKIEREGKLTFLEITQHFSNIFTRNRQATLRKRLAELALPNSGKITPTNWRAFEVEFRNCIRELPHMGREEIGECLRKKLANFMVTWVVERELELGEKCLRRRYRCHSGGDHRSDTSEPDDPGRGTHQGN